jgi:hypothetical protein
VIPESPFAMRDVETRLPFLESLIVLKRMVLMGALTGIALAHGLVLYKIDTGLRSHGLTPTMASRSHKTFW